MNKKTKVKNKNNLKLNRRKSKLKNQSNIK